MFVALTTGTVVSSVSCAPRRRTSANTLEYNPRIDCFPAYLLQLFQALRNVESYVDQCSVGLILQNKSTHRVQTLLEYRMFYGTGKSLKQERIQTICDNFLIKKELVIHDIYPIKKKKVGGRGGFVI